MRAADRERVFALEPLGETSLLLRFGERIDAAVNARVQDRKSVV